MKNHQLITFVYEDNCYTLIRVNSKNLDRATLTCTDYYNGILYNLDNTTVNVAYGAQSGTGNAIIVDPTEYSLFTPQEGYFNLYTSYEADGYPKNPNCVSIESDGTCH